MGRFMGIPGGPEAFGHPAICPVPPGRDPTRGAGVRVSEHPAVGHRGRCRPRWPGPRRRLAACGWHSAPPPAGGRSPGAAVTRDRVCYSVTTRPSRTLQHPRPDATRRRGTATLSASIGTRATVARRLTGGACRYGQSSPLSACGWAGPLAPTSAVTARVRSRCGPRHALTIWMVRSRASRRAMAARRLSRDAHPCSICQPAARRLAQCSCRASHACS